MRVYPAESSPPPQSGSASFIPGAYLFPCSRLRGRSPKTRERHIHHEKYLERASGGARSRRSPHFSGPIPPLRGATTRAQEQQRAHCFYGRHRSSIEWKTRFLRAEAHRTTKSAARARINFSFSGGVDIVCSARTSGFDRARALYILDFDFRSDNDARASAHTRQKRACRGSRVCSEFAMVLLGCQRRVKMRLLREQV